MKLTFKEARERIIQAYFKDELEPYNNCGCFVGNLLGGMGLWQHGLPDDCLFNVQRLKGSALRLRIHGLILIIHSGYTRMQISDLEKCFIHTLEICGIDMDYEDALFNAMDVTLDMLKEIHISNGEVIEEEFIFTKRKLEKAPM